MFKLSSDGLFKGFQLTFKNGTTVSCQWGNDSYSDNRNKQEPSQESQTAELAFWQTEADEIEPVGWQTTEEFALYLIGALRADKALGEAKAKQEEQNRIKQQEQPDKYPYRVYAANGFYAAYKTAEEAKNESKLLEKRLQEQGGFWKAPITAYRFTENHTLEAL